ncbi:hypothetical protein GIB67_024440, partial [Kingdonia uniflora]
MPEEGLEVVIKLMVDDDVEVNLEAKSSEYGSGLLKDNEKDDDDKKDVEEEVKFEEEQPQVVEEEDSEPPTVVVYYNGTKDVQHANETMVVAKTNIVFFNHEKVVGKAYQTSANQTTVVSIEELTVEVAKTKDKASQASTDITTVVSVEEQTIEVAKTKSSYLQTKESKENVKQSKEEVIEGKDDNDGNSQKKPAPVQAIKEWLLTKQMYEVIDVYSKALIQYFDTQYRARSDKEKIVLTDVFACQYISRDFNVWTHNMLSLK